MGDNWNDPNPHDGRHGRCGCGQGYSWNDEQNYRGGRNSGGSGGYGYFILLVIVVSVIGVFNEFLAILITLVGGFVLIAKHW